MNRQTSKNPLVTMVATATLSAISLVVYLLLEFPMLPSAAYLKMDFSDVPAAFGAVVFGPACGVMVELIKNLLEMLIRGMGTQMGFGNLQNFLIGCGYILPYALLYRLMDRKGTPLSWKLVLPCAAGIVSILVVGFFSNWVIAPLFFEFFLNTPLGPAEAVAAAWVSVPFNALKGLILTAILIPLMAMALKPVRRMLGQAR